MSDHRRGGWWAEKEAKPRLAGRGRAQPPDDDLDRCFSCKTNVRSSACFSVHVYNPCRIFVFYDHVTRGMVSVINQWRAHWQTTSVLEWADKTGNYKTNAKNRLPQGYFVPLGKKERNPLIDERLRTGWRNKANRNFIVFFFFPSNPLISLSDIDSRKEKVIKRT